MSKRKKTVDPATRSTELREQIRKHEHAYYVLDLRHADGWVGYGGRIHGARFKALARPGEAMELECRATQLRRTPASVLARYDFRFVQAGTLVYEGDQTALWSKVDAPG